MRRVLVLSKKLNHKKRTKHSSSQTQSPRGGQFYPAQSVRTAIAYMFLFLALVATIAPSAHAQLRYINATDSSITIAWGAPGDDGCQGTATIYDIRYDTVNLTPDEWDSAFVPLIGLPDPAPAGTIQSYEVVINDYTDREYHIGLRAVDEADNWSVISNQVVLLPRPSPLPENIAPTIRAVILSCDTVETSVPVSYLFEIDESNDFSSPNVQRIQGTVSGDTAWTYFDNLDPEIIYYWRYHAVANDSSQATLWSEAQFLNLKNGLGDCPSTPQGIYPIDSVVVIGTLPTVIWNRASDSQPDILSYFIEIWNYDEIILIDSCYDLQDTTWTVNAGVLSLGSTYNWKIRSFDGSCYSAWSDTTWTDFIRTGSYVFQVAPFSSGNTPGTIKDPYPSPVNFNQGDLLTFEFPATPATLRILNSAGDLVYLEANLSGTWQWNGRNQSGQAVASGHYLWYVSNNLGEGIFTVVR